MTERPAYKRFADSKPTWMICFITSTSLKGTILWSEITFQIGVTIGIISSWHKISLLDTTLISRQAPVGIQNTVYGTNDVGCYTSFHQNTNIQHHPYFFRINFKKVQELWAYHRPSKLLWNNVLRREIYPSRLTRVGKNCRKCSLAKGETNSLCQSVRQYRLAYGLPPGSRLLILNLKIELFSYKGTFIIVSCITSNSTNW
jgi:hypothetical protein